VVVLQNSVFANEQNFSGALVRPSENDVDLLAQDQIFRFRRSRLEE
jgi:hypothetical protein